MLFEAIVGAVLAAHVNVSARRADYLASSIVYAAGEDVSAVAAMIVNLRAETGGLEVYERCWLPELGGWGAFGISEIWESRMPGATCGPIDVQARAAYRILDWHAYEDPARAFGFYIGARARERHPEAKRRAALHWIIRWEMENLACL